MLLASTTLLHDGLLLNSHVVKMTKMRSDTKRDGSVISKMPRKPSVDNLMSLGGIQSWKVNHFFSSSGIFSPSMNFRTALEMLGTMVQPVRNNCRNRKWKLSSLSICLYISESMMNCKNYYSIHLNFNLLQLKMIHAIN